MISDDPECIYVDGHLESSATFDRSVSFDLEGSNGRPQLECTAHQLLKSFSKVHICSTVGQTLRLLDSRPPSNPPPTFILVCIDDSDEIITGYHVGDAKSRGPIMDQDGNAIVSSDLVESLKGLSLLYYLNVLKKRRKFGFALTVACLDTTNKSVIRRLFDLGTDDVVKRNPKVEEFQRLSRTLYKECGFRPHHEPLSDAQDTARYERADFRPTQLQWDSLRRRVQSVYLAENLSGATMLDDHLPPYSEPKMAGATYYASEAYLSKVPEIQQRVSSWSFCTLHLSEDDLMDCAAVIFKHVLSQPGTEAWRISDTDLYAFLDTVRMSYYSTNPYHNFRHAVDVLQAVFFILLSSNCLPRMNDQCPSFDGDVSPALVKIVTPQYVLGACIVGIGHDVGHPGVNNAFLVTTSSPLALLYNDRSVLENLHCAVLSRMLRQRWPSTQDPGMRKVILELILSTDMALHFDYMSRVKEVEGVCLSYRSAKGSPAEKEAEIDTSDAAMNKYRSTLFSALIKCGDISNVARPFEISSAWSQVLLSEFFNQARLEKSLGLPVTKTMDPEQIRQADSQVFFMHLFAHPLFSALETLLPSLQPIVANIIANRDTWKSPESPAAHAPAPNSVDTKLEPVAVPTSTPSAGSLEQQDVGLVGSKAGSSPTKKGFFIPQFLKKNKNKEVR